jgi:hypothetical protein
MDHGSEGHVLGSGAMILLKCFHSGMNVNQIQAAFIRRPVS